MSPRHARAVALGAAAVAACVLAARIPIEGGGLLFGPLLLAVACCCGWLAISLVERRRQPVEPNLLVLGVVAVAFLVKVLVS
jgi:hypothetical protein